MTEQPICPYCQRPARLHAMSNALYHGRDYGPAWVCSPCGAWVGCHPGTTNPLGRLADRDLRKAKQEAHAVFDPLWRAKQCRYDLTKRDARNQGYRWLAFRLGISRDACHIGMFDLETCRRVVEICKPHADKIKEKSWEKDSKPTICMAVLT